MEGSLGSISKLMTNVMPCSHFGFPIKKNFEEVYTREIVTM
jgi:hypothetical protein